MTKLNRKLRSNSSGQLLIVAALAIAVLISSTTAYVYDLSRQTNTLNDHSISDLLLALKQSSRNIMIGSLANVSNGGERTMLATNLDKFSQLVRNLHYSGEFQMAFTVLNDSAYDSGIWLSQDTSGVGMSSAYGNFTVQAYSLTQEATTQYTLNVTTTLLVNGSYTMLPGGEKLVSLTCRVYNEGEPALAKNITLFYAVDSNWTEVDASNNLSIIDRGDGAYLLSFAATTPQDPVQVLVQVRDFRDIFVQSNTTCPAV
jgi:hypothetical protein